MSSFEKDEFSTTKYIIRVNIEVDGVVEKPDVVGAIFGQTEGLLGGELDLRELQKTGRIGRIGVDIEIKSGKAVGEIVIPSSLDRTETAILAAALETIDRVGPCTARISLKKIEDIRESKREKILDRAVDILKNWTETVAPESQEITEAVLRAIRTGTITKYGPEKLPAGPAIDESDSIIVVEGRADVLNLLKYGFKNAIAVEGTNIPETIINLCNEKTVTVFTDGDRGGELILRELMQVAEIDYVARAPPGKEVEDLTRKEIIKCLRNKVPIEQILNHKEHVKEKRREYEKKVEKKKEHKKEKVKYEKKKAYKERKAKPLVKLDEKIIKLIEEIPESLEAVILNEDGEITERVSVAKLADKLNEVEKADTIIFDGVITQRIVDLAYQKNVKYIIGARIGKIQKKPLEVNLLIFNDIEK
ncbi:MAG: DNA primase DnaG [Candidatus Odinarchaeia archaeon]